MNVLPAFGDLDPSAHRRHFMHDDARMWPETNCYVDLWIEVLHALGLNPVAGLVCCVTAGFNGEQWDLFKFQIPDLRALYGVSVAELNLWLTLEEHIIDHGSRGNMLLVDVDSWYLPDTAGTAYQVKHQKTTIAPLGIDPQRRTLVYVHNRGLYTLAGDDYVGVLRHGAPPQDLLPYTELVRFDDVVERSDDELRAAVRPLLADQLHRASGTNQIRLMQARVAADEQALISREAEFFHGYAFATLRPCGAWAECLATFLQWLDAEGLGRAVTALFELSATAKAMQFRLARLASGRPVDLSEQFHSMANHWDVAYEVMRGSSWASSAS